MKRVTGIGGIFFKAKDAPALQACTSGTSESMSRNGVARRSPGPTVKVSRLPEPPSGPLVRRKVTSLGPSAAMFMVNYRVEDLHALVKVLREEGCNVLEKIDDSEVREVAWVIASRKDKVQLCNRLPANDPGSQMRTGSNWSRSPRGIKRFEGTA